MIEKENTVSSDLVYTGKTISLRVDTVEVPNKGYQKREIVEHNGVVVIIGITEDNKINENPRECAIREFRQKTGYDAENFKLIHKFYPTVGISNQMMFIYLAKKLEKCEDKKEDYQIEIQEIDFDKVYKMVLNNEIVDGKTSLGVLLCKDIIN